MSDFDVSVGVDASQAERGAETVRRSIREIKAQVSSLQQSLSDLGRSQRTIDSMTRRFSEAAQSTQKLARMGRDLGAPLQIIGNLSRALDQLGRSLTSNVNNVAGMNRAFRTFSNELGQSQAQITRWQNALGGTQRGLQSMMQSARNTSKEFSSLVQNLGRVSQSGVSTASARRELDALHRSIVSTALSMNSGSTNVKEMTQVLEQLTRAVSRAQNAMGTLRNASEGAGSTISRAASSATRVRTVGTADVVRAQTGLNSNAELSRMGDYYRNLEQQSRKYTSSLREQVSASAAGRRSTGEFVDALGRADRAHKTAANSIIGHSHALRGFHGLLWSTTGAVQAFTATLALREITQGIVTLQQISNSFRAVEGDAERGSISFQRASDLSDRYGISLEATARSFAKYQAAAKQSSLTQEQTNRLFESTVIAVRAMGLSGADAEGIFRALEQMMSKGKVMAEELRLQLGDRLPGAFNMMAEAAGVSTAQLDKMLQAGEVGIEHLVKFADVLRARFGDPDAMFRAVRSLPAELERLNNAFLRATGVIGEGGFTEAITKAVVGLRKFLESQEGIRVLHAMGEGARILSDAIIILAQNWEKVALAFGAVIAIRLGVWLYEITRSVALLNTAVVTLWRTVAAHPFTLLATVIGGVAVAMASMRQEADPLAETMNRLDKVHEGLARSGKLLSESFADVRTLTERTGSTFSEGATLNTQYGRTLLEVGFNAKEAAGMLRELSFVELSRQAQKTDEDLQKAAAGVNSSLKQISDGAGKAFNLVTTGSESGVSDIPKVLKEGEYALANFLATYQRVTGGLRSGQDLSAAAEAMREAMRDFFNLVPKDDKKMIETATGFMNLWEQTLKNEIERRAASDSNEIKKLLAEAFFKGNDDVYAQFGRMNSAIQGLLGPKALETMNEKFGISADGVRTLKDALREALRLVVDGKMSLADFAGSLDALQTSTIAAAQGFTDLSKGMNEKQFLTQQVRLTQLAAGMADGKSAALLYGLELKHAANIENEYFQAQALHLGSIAEYQDLLKDLRTAIRDKNTEEQKAIESQLKALPVMVAATAAAIKHLQLLNTFKEQLVKGGTDVVNILRIIDHQVADSYNSTFEKFKGISETGIERVRSTTKPKKGPAGVGNTFVNQKNELEEIINAWADADNTAEEYYSNRLVNGQHFSEDMVRQLADTKNLANAIKEYQKLEASLIKQRDKAQYRNVDSGLKDLLVSVDKLGAAEELLKRIQEAMGRVGVDKKLQEKVTAQFNRSLEKQRQIYDGLTDDLKEYNESLRKQTDEQEATNAVALIELNNYDNAGSLIAEINRHRERSVELIKYEADMKALKSKYDALENSNTAEAITLREQLLQTMDDRTQLHFSRNMAADIKFATQAVRAELEGPMGKAFKGFYEGIRGGLIDAFEAGLAGSESAWEDLMETFKRTFRRMLAELAFEAFAKPVLIPVMQGIGTSFGLSPQAINQVVGGGNYQPGAGQPFSMGGGGGLSSFNFAGQPGTSVETINVYNGSGVSQVPVSGSNNNLFSTGLNRLFGNGSMQSFSSWLNTPLWGGGQPLAGTTALGSGGIGSDAALAGGGGALGASGNTTSMFSVGPTAMGAAGSGLGGFFTGMAIGGMMKRGNKAGGALGGAAAGAVQGAMVAGPWGAVIGAIAGAIGGLIGAGNKPSNKAAGGNYDFSSGVRLDHPDPKGKSTDETRKARDDIYGVLDKVRDAFKGIGASFDALKISFNVGTRDDWKFNINGGPEIASSKNDPEGFLLKLIKNIGLQAKGVSEDVAFVLAHSTATKVEELLNQLEFAGNFQDSVNQLRDATDELAQSFNSGKNRAKEFNNQIKDLLSNTAKNFATNETISLPAYAGGTESAVYGMALVGEHGPELVGMRGGERVLNAGQTAKALAGMGQGRDNVLVHLRKDELDTLRRTWGGKLNSKTGLWGFDSGGGADQGIDYSNIFKGTDQSLIEAIINPAPIEKKVVLKPELDKYHISGEHYSDVMSAVSDAAAGKQIDASKIDNPKAWLTNINSIKEALTAAGAEVPAAFTSLEKQLKVIDAARDSIIRQVTGMQPPTETQKLVSEAQGFWEGMKETMKTAGYSAEQISNSQGTGLADQGLRNEMNRIRKDFVKSIDAQINSASGKGILNEVTSALDGYQDNVRSLASLGMDSSKAVELVNAQLTSLVKNSSLTAEQFGMLRESLKGFPEALAALDQAIRKDYEAKAGTIFNNMVNVASKFNPNWSPGARVTLAGAGVDINVMKDLTKSLFDFDTKAKSGAATMQDLDGAFETLNQNFLAGKLSAEQYGTMITWATDRFITGQQKMITAAQESVKNSDTIRKAYLGLASRVDPKFQYGPMNALLNSGVNPNSVPALKGKLDSFFNSAKSGTLDLQKLLTAYDDVTASFKEGKLTSEQYTSVLGELDAAFDKTATKIEDTIDALKGFSKDISEFLKNMNTDSLSVLGPEAKYKAARDNFLESLNAVNNGDLSRVNEVFQNAQTYRQAASDYFGTAPGFTSVDTEIKTLLGQAKIKADLQVDLTEDQNDLVKTSNTLLTGIQQRIDTSKNSTISEMQRLSGLEKDATDNATKAIQNMQQALTGFNGAQQAANPLGSIVGNGGVGIGQGKDTIGRTLSSRQDTTTLLSVGEHQAIARSLGYTGTFGSGQHSAWLSADTTGKRLADFNAAIAQANSLLGSVANPGRNWGGADNFASNREIARLTGYTGDFGAGLFDQWILSQPESVKAAARMVLTSYGQANRITFADGGIMSEFGPVPLRRFGSGGIARYPQLAVYGEGTRPEAFVPLEDGRTIPVTIVSNGTANNTSPEVCERLENIERALERLILTEAHGGNNTIEILEEMLVEQKEVRRQASMEKGKR